MPKGKGYPMKRSKWEDGTQAVNQNHSTPHQKSLAGRIGVEKAMGMGRVKRIKVRKGKSY